MMLKALACAWILTNVVKASGKAPRPKTFPTSSSTRTPIVVLLNYDEDEAAQAFTQGQAQSTTITDSTKPQQKGAELDTIDSVFVSHVPAQPLPVTQSTASLQVGRKVDDGLAGGISGLTIDTSRERRSSHLESSGRESGQSQQGRPSELPRPSSSSVSTRVHVVVPQPLTRPAGQTTSRLPSLGTPSTRGEGTQPQPALAPRSIPRLPSLEGIGTDYRLALDPKDHKVKELPRGPTREISRYEGVEKMKIGKWVEVHYEPGVRGLGEEQYSLNTDRPGILKFYDPHWTGCEFIVRSNGKDILTPRASIVKNYELPDKIEKFEVDDPRNDEGWNFVAPGSRVFSVFVSKASRDSPWDPIVYLRFDTLKTAKTCNGKYILVKEKLPAVNWRSISGVLGGKNLAKIPEGQAGAVSEDIDRAFGCEDNIVLIGEYRYTNTCLSHYLCLHTKDKDAYTHKSNPIFGYCYYYMLFNA